MPAPLGKILRQDSCKLEYCLQVPSKSGSSRFEYARVQTRRVSPRKENLQAEEAQNHADSVVQKWEAIQHVLGASEGCFFSC